MGWNRGRGRSHIILISGVEFSHPRETQTLRRSHGAQTISEENPFGRGQKLFLAGIDASTLASETVPVEDALNRVTAEPVFAKISSPHYHAAAMDGICVRAEDTFGATEFVGKKLTRALKDMSGSGVFAYVDTGNSLLLGPMQSS